MCYIVTFYYSIINFTWIIIIIMMKSVVYLFIGVYNNMYISVFGMKPFCGYGCVMQASDVTICIYLLKCCT